MLGIDKLIELIEKIFSVDILKKAIVFIGISVLFLNLFELFSSHFYANRDYKLELDTHNKSVEHMNNQKNQEEKKIELMENKHRDDLNMQYENNKNVLESQEKQNLENILSSILMNRENIESKESIQREGNEIAKQYNQHLIDNDNFEKYKYQNDIEFRKDLFNAINNKTPANTPPPATTPPPTLEEQKKKEEEEQKRKNEEHSKNEDKKILDYNAYKDIKESYITYVKSYLIKKGTNENIVYSELSTNIYNWIDKNIKQKIQNNKTLQEIAIEGYNPIYPLEHEEWFNIYK